MITHHEIVIGHINKECELFISPNMNSLSSLCEALIDFFLIDLNNKYKHFNNDICYRYEIYSVPLFQNSKLNLHVLKDGQFFNIFECFSFY